jgi:hypothetical protein
MISGGGKTTLPPWRGSSSRAKWSRSAIFEAVAGIVAADVLRAADMGDLQPIRLAHHESHRLTPWETYSDRRKTLFRAIALGRYRCRVALTE